MYNKNGFIEKKIKLFNERYDDKHPLTDYEKRRFKSAMETPKGTLYLGFIASLISIFFGPIILTISCLFSDVGILLATPWVVLLLGIIIKIIFHNAVVLWIGIILMLILHIICGASTINIMIYEYKEAKKRYNTSDEELDKEEAFNALKEYVTNIAYGKQSNERFAEKDLQLLRFGSLSFDNVLEEKFTGEFCVREKFFHNILTVDELKKKYRDLMKQYHPDNVKNMNNNDDNSKIITNLKRDYESYKFFLEYLSKDATYQKLFKECEKYFVS